MVNRLVDTGRTYGMEKSQVMRISGSNELLQIKVNNKKKLNLWLTAPKGATPVN